MVSARRRRKCQSVFPPGSGWVPLWVPTLGQDGSHHPTPGQDRSPDPLLTSLAYFSHQENCVFILVDPPGHPRHVLIFFQR